MRILQNLAIIITIVLLTSCASTTTFPVSVSVPAADITVKTKKQGKTNYQVTIEAENLAASDRLNPPKEYYVIWAVSDAGVIRNVGHFIQENAEKATYKASFPYQPVEVFITAEDEQGGCEPFGMEIARAKL
jgi:TRAP-type uncharacterized transport system substrate-binding protein